MNLIPVVMVAVGGLGLAANIANASAVELIRDGEAVARIYHAPLNESADARAYDPDINVPRRFARELSDEQKHDKWLANAIDDLNYHLQRMSGTALEIVVTDDPQAVQGPAVVIGPLAQTMGGSPTAPLDVPETFRLRVGDDVVLIAGHGHYGKIGAAHGVYDLLGQLGCDWLFPGREGEVIPERATIAIDAQDIQDAPSFNPRHAWYGGMQRDLEAQFEFFRWKQRMRMHPNSLLIDTSRIGGHSWSRIIRMFRDEFEANPEMYALRRRPDGSLERGGPQLETTHPRVIELAIEYIRHQFETNGWPHDKRVTIPFGPSDGGGMSESPESRLAGTERLAIDSGRPDGTDLIVLLLNTLLEQTEDEFPNLHLGFFLYSWHSDYPQRYRPHPRLAIEIADLNFSRLHGVMCPTSRQRAYFRSVLELWGRLHQEQGTLMHRYNYGYNVANGYLPLSMVRIWGESIPFDHSIGVSGQRFNLYDNWEVTGANNYLGARLAWDHTLDWRQVLREFCEKAYGSGADAMERYFLATAQRQRDAGIETGAFFAYPLVYDLAFVDEMDELLAEAHRDATTDLERTRVEYMMIQPQRLRMFLDMHEKICNFQFTEARTVYEQMREAHAADAERNRQFSSAMGARFLEVYANRFLTESNEYSSDPYRIVYRVPERLKIILDSYVMGQHQRFFGRSLNDEHHMTASTYRATWDAQGFAGYRKGAVWYRIPFEVDASQLEVHNGKPTLGLFIGGGEGVINIWCNEQFVGRVHAYLTTPHVLDLTDFIEPGEENLLALQLNRVGNDELGTGGLIFPSFLFTGPRVEVDERSQQRPFRVLPGGILEYVE